MDQGRRGRRGRRSAPLQHVPFRCCNTFPKQCKPWSFLSGIYSFCIMSSLMALIYLMLEYHCTSCAAKYDLRVISQNIDEITKSLTLIKESYYELEQKISKLSQDLPKIEGQIDILESFANTIEGQDFGWNPKTHLTLPHMDHLNKFEHGRNTSRKYSKQTSTDEAYATKYI